MVLATLTLGLTVSYILDSLDFKPNALFSIWLSLIFTHIAFFFLPLSAPWGKERGSSRRVKMGRFIFNIFI
jgi:hypothetical protein